MNKIVPHQNSFEFAKKAEFWQFISLYVSTASIIGTIVLSAIKKPIPEILSAIKYSNTSASFFAIAYLVLEALMNIKFYQGSKEKRVDLIDNAFDTNFGSEKSQGYYNPGGATPGVYKLAVLSFENTLFTSQVSRKMTIGRWVVTSLISTVFIVSACMGNEMIVNNFIQIAFAGILITQTIRLQQFANRVCQIHEDFRTLFNNMKDVTDKKTKEGEMLRNVLNYEATLASGSVLLSSKIFKRNNDSLSDKWEEMKVTYKI